MDYVNDENILKNLLTMLRLSRDYNEATEENVTRLQMPVQHFCLSLHIQCTRDRALCSVSFSTAGFCVEIVRYCGWWRRGTAGLSRVRRVACLAARDSALRGCRGGLTSKLTASGARVSARGGGLCGDGPARGGG